MKLHSFGFIKHGLVMAMIVLSFASAVPNNPFLGIPPQDESYYKVSSDTIKCKDGSNTFTKLQLNDDFCDCPDATDEPATSACPSGRFYCRNAGHAPLFLFSSRVNDGICDCCDGSDEYDGTVKCPNICWEAGKVARDKLKKRIATYKEGVALRKKDVEQAKVAFTKDEAELSKLKSEEKILKDQVQQLKERKEQIEEAEEKERLQKAKEERERKEAEERANKEKSEAAGKDKQETGKSDENEDQHRESAHDHIGVMDDASPYPDTEEEDGDFPSEADHSYASESIGTPVDAVEEHAEATEEKSTSLESKDETDVASETVLHHGSDESSDLDKKAEDDVSEKTEGMSREELGRLVASRWTGSSNKQTDEIDDTQDNDHEDNEDHEEILPDTHDEQYDAYASDNDDESGRYDDMEDDVEEDKYEGDTHDDTSSSYKSESDDDDTSSSNKSESDDELDFSETISRSISSWLETIKKTARSILQAINLFQTPVDKSEAARIRKEYKESNSKLSKIQSRISSLTQKLKHDFGSEKEFYSFYDQCFEGRENKYVYKVCPFKHASQMEGHSTTRLGSWDKFEESYRVMVFSNGEKCWNGPDRSLKVKLRCGLRNEVTDVDEPSRCEYGAILWTTAVCLEEKLKELEEKVEMMKREEGEKQDEL